MVRRWSCLNKFNFAFSFSLYFFPRFDTFKSIKALNYKKYRAGFSKFKRQKLSRWKRRSSWLMYTQIMRYWIWDYNRYKQLVKSQFLDSIFLNISYIYNFNYIKRKNPLNVQLVRIFLLNSFPKFFYFYFYNKFKSKTPLNFLRAFMNSNFLLAYTYEQNPALLQNDSKIIPILIKAENSFYSCDSDVLEKKKICKFLIYFHFYLI
jgi:hypothetical protein